MLDHIAEETIRGSMKIAAAEGAGLGMGGMFTIIPDLGILAAITIRMIQKLSLIYGFAYNTEQEEAELWVAAASAAGVDISRELVEKQVVSKFVPRVIQRIAAQSQRRNRREMDRPPHPGRELRHWRRTELLLHARLGTARRAALPPAAPGVARAAQLAEIRRSRILLPNLLTYGAASINSAASGLSLNSPSHFAITTLARQLPSTLTAVRPMSSNGSTPSRRNSGALGSPMRCRRRHQHHK